MPKQLFLEHGGFDENLHTCEDYDLWLRLMVKSSIGFVHKKLVTKFGGHPDQLSKKFPMMDKYRIIALEKLLSQGHLNHHQTELVQNELRVKKDIIAQGRRKRETHETIRKSQKQPSS